MMLADAPVSVQQTKVRQNAGFVRPACQHALRKEKGKKDYIFRCQFNGKPSFTLGCPGQHALIMKATAQSCAVMRCGYSPELCSHEVWLKPIVVQS